MSGVAAAIALAWRVSHRWMLLIGALTVANGLLPVAAAWFAKGLFDELGKGTAADAATAVRFAVAASGTSVAALVCMALAGYAALAAQAAIARGIDRDLYNKINGFIGLDRFEDPRFQERMMLAQNAATQTSGMVLSFAASVVQSTLRIAAFLAVMLAAWPMMALLLFLAAVPELVAQLMLARHRARASEISAHHHRLRGMFQHSLVDVRSAREVRLFGLGTLFRGRMTGALDRAVSVELRSERHATAVQGALAVFGAAVAAAGAVYAVLGVVSGQFSIGDVTFFLAAVAGIQAGLSAIIGQLSHASYSLTMFKHYRALSVAGQDMADGSRAAPPLAHSIELRDVWFRYTPDGPWVLRGVTATIAAGSSVGLVGVNGAGKSTLIKLLCRFYDPDRGQILWDGIDLRELSVETLRRRVSAIFQDFVGYDLSAQQNIGIGRVEAIDHLPAVREAARAAGVDATLAALPNGYASVLGRAFAGPDEEGAQLSGGQWQRVALARSLMRRDADLLILDEPSSGLDASAEQRMHERVRCLRRGRTNILISHRLSAIRACDVIIVLGDGRIAGQGTHDELMTLGGDYAELFTTQAAGYR